MQTVVPSVRISDCVVMGNDSSKSMRNVDVNDESLLDRDFARAYRKAYKKKDGKYPKFEIMYGVGDTSIRYSLAVVDNPSAKFINFCGLSIDISTLNVALGLFPSTEYICVMSFKDIFNYVAFGDCESTKLTFDDIVYFIEMIKCSGTHGNVLKELKSIAADKFVEDSTLEYSSIVINCIKKKTREYEGVTEDKELNCVRGFSNEKDFMYSLMSTCLGISRKLDSVASALFKNFIIEDDVSEVIGNMSSKVSDMLDTGTNSKNLEALRLRYLNKGLPDVLVDGLISYGFGLNKRKLLYKEALNGGISIVEQSMMAFNSMAYVEVYTSGNVLSGVMLSKAYCYSILDLLRAVGWEQDLLFSYEVERDFQNSILVEHIFNKFDLSHMLESVGISSSEFRECVSDYQSRYMHLVDCGAMYSRRVRKSQYAMGTFCKPMIVNSGKIFEKMSSRLLNKF